MKFTLVLAALTSVAVATPGFSPNVMHRRTYTFNCGNNCGRAVKSYSSSSVIAAQHLADCQSYLAVTSTRPAPTYTETRTVPSYIGNACIDKDEYASACGCVTATPATVWVDAPTVTVVQYV